MYPYVNIYCWAYVIPIMVVPLQVIVSALVLEDQIGLQLSVPRLSSKVCEHELSGTYVRFCIRREGGAHVHNTACTQVLLLSTHPPLFPSTLMSRHKLPISKLRMPRPVPTRHWTGQLLPTVPHVHAHTKPKQHQSTIAAMHLTLKLKPRSLILVETPEKHRALKASVPIAIEVHSSSQLRKVVSIRFVLLPKRTSF